MELQAGGLEKVQGGDIQYGCSVEEEAEKKV